MTRFSRVFAAIVGPIAVALLSGCACWVPFIGAKGEFSQATADSITAFKSAAGPAYEPLTQTPPDTSAISGLRQRVSAQMTQEQTRACNGGVKSSLKEANDWLLSSQQRASSGHNGVDVVREARVRAEDLLDAALRAESKKK